MKLSVSEIEERIDARMDERTKLYREMDKWQDAWAGKVWKKTKQAALNIDGVRQVTTPAPINTVQLAMRLIDSKPKIQVPVDGDDAEGDVNAALAERWLNVVWEQIAIEQIADPIVGASWQSFVQSRHVMQVMWIKDALPKKLQDQRLPFTVRTLDPRNAGTYHNGLYTEYGWHTYTERYGAVKARYSIGSKKAFKGIDDEDEIDVKDFYWVGKDGDILNAVIVGDDFAKKPVKTNYLQVPIVEGYGDYAPLNQEEFKSLSLLAPMLESWLYDCDLKSQMATGILYYFWPFLIATNDEGRPIKDIEIRPGLIKAVEPGTRIESIIGSPNSQLVQNMSAMMEQNIQQSSFPDVLHGKAPGDVQAGYGIDILAQSARGRINSFRKNLERTITTCNAIMLDMLSWPLVGSKGIQVYGLAPQDQKGRYYTLTEKQVDGKYRTITNLKVDLDSSKLQRQTFWLRLVEAGIISKRTFLETILPDEVPEDELTRVAVQEALDSDEMKPKKMLYALKDYFPADGEEDADIAEWPDVIRNTPFEALAKQEEVQEEPTMPDIPPLGAMPPEMMPPASGDMSMMMGGPPPGPSGSPPGPPPGPPIQPEMPMSPAMPPETQGGLTPELLGAGADFPPELWDALMNQSPETLNEIMRRMQGGEG